MNIYERVRKAQAAAEKAAKAAEYKAGESARRSQAGRVAASIKRDTRMERVLSGEVEPRTAAEYDAWIRASEGPLDFDD
jgi:hypothetical protein